MTVKELIQALKKCDPEKEVVFECGDAGVKHVHTLNPRQKMTSLDDWTEIYPITHVFRADQVKKIELVIALNS